MTKVHEYTREELKWYYCNSDAEVGYKSSWQACVNAACFGHIGGADPYTDKMLKAISAKRRIDEIMRLIPTLSQYVLFSMFGPTFYSAEVEAEYKKLAGPACCIIHHDELTALCKQKQNGTLKSADKALMVYVRIRAEKERDLALELYGAAKKQLKDNRR
jgi:hypothetical protein